MVEKPRNAMLRLVDSSASTKANAPRQKTAGALLTEKVRQRIFETAGLGECIALCDVGEMDHVCYLIPGAFAAVRVGQPALLTPGLRSHLIGPLERYVPTLSVLPTGAAQRKKHGINPGARMELESTLGLLAAAKEVIRRLEFGPWDEARAIETKNLLRGAWCEWIAYVSSYWVWSEVPKKLAEKELRREHGKLGRGVPKNGAERKSAKKEGILRDVARLSKRIDRHQVAGVVANIHDVTPQYVRKLQRQSEEKSETKSDPLVS